ncbi:serine/arginine repetitive matrix protein 2 [Drosophila biarmipes]|uniref:serine/arginine repetitive matrix protein 2 n=1 Tax=Drosophila biarmipes TaxID=125945 RepID=UPI0007E62E3A|nr:serine/arginine repetitive matrix protein 2 [Drosophila biarmipes]
MKTRSGKALTSSGRDFDSRPRKAGRPSCTPQRLEKNNRMEPFQDISETSNQCVQGLRPLEGHTESTEEREQDAVLEGIHIKSEPICEDIWDVLDELGDILDEAEEQADMMAKETEADLLEEEHAESNDYGGPLIPPPPPSISLTDDLSLYTRRSRPYNETSPVSFVESLQESGEISSSELSAKSINSPEIPLEFRCSPEENPERCRFMLRTSFLKAKHIKPDQRSFRSKSKERKRARKKSPSLQKQILSRTPSPQFRCGIRSPALEAKRRSSPASHRRRRSQSRNHTHSRRKSHSRDRQARGHRSPPRRGFRSRSRSPNRTSHFRSIRNWHPNRRSRDTSPSIRHLHSPFRGRPRSPVFKSRSARRYSPVRRPRHHSRSTSRPAKSLVRQRLENKVTLRDRSRSRSRPARKPIQERSRSRLKSAKVTQRMFSRSASQSPSKSKNRSLEKVSRQHSCSRTNDPKIPIQGKERSRSRSQPLQKPSVKPLVERSRSADQGANVEAKLPVERTISPISPRPISPMVTLHDNRIKRPNDLRQYLLPTPAAPQIVYTQTHYTQLEYSAHQFPGHLPGPIDHPPPALYTFGRPPPMLGPFDLRRRLATTRSLYYLAPNDLRHRIQDMYASPPDFNVYAEWPTEYPEQYPARGYF